MSPVNALPHTGADWQREIRAREDDVRRAFVAGDVQTLDALWSDAFTVNSPLNDVRRKGDLLALIGAGRLRHLSLDGEIEHMSRHGDVVVVMGRETVADPPEGRTYHRRFTDVWRMQDGVWRTIARHANLVTERPA